ncbi:hypothetical protein M3Y95_00894700 [Aphelenchoides besseyi]|nr:hypothetical protein M3Y95_00894700 [Aphelenchoides besseyi]
MSSVYQKPHPVVGKSHPAASTKSSISIKKPPEPKKKPKQRSGWLACCKKSQKTSSKKKLVRGSSTTRSSASKTPNRPSLLPPKPVDKRPLATYSPISVQQLAPTVGAVRATSIVPSKPIPAPPMKKKQPLDKKSDVACSQTESTIAIATVDSKRKGKALEEELTLCTTIQNNQIKRFFSYKISGPRQPKKKKKKVKRAKSISKLSSSGIDTPNAIRELSFTSSKISTFCSCYHPAPVSIGHSTCSCSYKTSGEVENSATTSKVSEQIKREIHNNPMVQEKLERTEEALRRAQDAIHKLNLLAGKNLLPEIPNFDAESAMILNEMDGLMERLQQLSTKS